MVKAISQYSEHVPDSKVHGANMGPTWVLSAPDGPHVGPMNLAIRDSRVNRTVRVLIRLYRMHIEYLGMLFWHHNYQFNCFFYINIPVGGKTACVGEHFSRHGTFALTIKNPQDFPRLHQISEHVFKISIAKEASKQYGNTYNFSVITLQWRHNGHDSVSNHQPHDCLLNHLFRRRSKKTSKLRVTGLYAANSLGTGEFPRKWPVTGKMFSFMIKLPEIGATQHKDGSADGTTRNQAHQREDIWTKGLRFAHCTHVTHCPQLTPGKWNDDGRHGPETTSFKRVGTHIAPHACHAPPLKSVLSCCTTTDPGHAGLI